MDDRKAAAGNDIQFSKARLEMLCDGVVTVAMTLLVLELSVPELPRQATSQEILHDLGQHILSFVGFAMTFALAGGFWIAHHIAFSYIRRVTPALTILTIPFLMSVAFLPFSMSMLTTFSLQQPVALVFYYGNQFMVALLLAIQWRVAQRQGLLEAADDPKRRKFGLILSLWPIGFAAALVMVFIAPREATDALMITQLAVVALARRLSRGTKAKTVSAQFS
jgi:uncharacterized membrane protein